MNLINMSLTGLSSFASNIKNNVVMSVSNTTSSYSSSFNNVVGMGLGLLGNALGNKLRSGLNGLSTSSAGNFLVQNQSDSIYDFLSHFKNGIMKSNRFRVEFSLPRGVSSSSNHFNAVNTNALSSRIRGVENTFNATGSINVKCHTVTFPVRSLQTLDFKSNSVNFKVPYGTSYEPISLSFYADANLDTREYFELWQSCVMNFGNNTTNFYNEYVSDVKIYMQNEHGQDTYGIILYECYPTMISMIDMSYSMNNTALNVLIALSYKSWLPMSNTNKFNRTV